MIKLVSDMRQVGDFLWFPPPLKLTATIYSWSIAESGVKHHNPILNPNQKIKVVQLCYLYGIYIIDSSFLNIKGNYVSIYIKNKNKNKNKIKNKNRNKFTVQTKSVCLLKGVDWLFFYITTRTEKTCIVH